MTDQEPKPVLNFTLDHQLPSGKNQIKIAMMYGHIVKYPEKRFKLWRTMSWEMIRQQRPETWRTLEAPARITVDYWPGDRIARDVPGIMDALCHAMEWCPVHHKTNNKKCECQLPVIRNDKFLVSWIWRTRELDRVQPRATVQIEVI